MMTEMLHSIACQLRNHYGGLPRVEQTRKVAARSYGRRAQCYEGNCYV